MEILRASSASEFYTAKTLGRPRKPVVNFGWIGAKMAFGYRFIDPIGVEFPCVISAAL